MKAGCRIEPLIRRWVAKCIALLLMFPILAFASVPAILSTDIQAQQRRAVAGVTTESAWIASAAQSLQEDVQGNYEQLLFHFSILKVQYSAYKTVLTEQQLDRVVEQLAALDADLALIEQIFVNYQSAPPSALRFRQMCRAVGQAVSAWTRQFNSVSSRISSPL